MGELGSFPVSGSPEIDENRRNLGRKRLIWVRVKGVRHHRGFN
jgi:hypothetical protein